MVQEKENVFNPKITRFDVKSRSRHHLSNNLHPFFNWTSLLFFSKEFTRYENGNSQEFLDFLSFRLSTVPTSFSRIAVLVKKNRQIERIYEKTSSNFVPFLLFEKKMQICLVKLKWDTVWLCITFVFSRFFRRNIFFCIFSSNQSVIQLSGFKTVAFWRVFSIKYFLAKIIPKTCRNSEHQLL